MMNWTTGLDPRWEGVSIPKEHWHFLRRLWDRYSMTLEPGEFSQITRAIRSGKALAVQRKGGGEVVYSVSLKARDERIYVVAVGERLVTALAPGKRLKVLRRRARIDRESLDTA